MGHEELIQQKILAAEIHPVTWDKERVWSNVSLEKASPPRSYLWYYAAASFLVVACLVTFWTAENKNEASQPKFAMIEPKQDASPKNDKGADSRSIFKKSDPARNEKKEVSFEPTAKKTTNKIKILTPDTVRAGSFALSLPEEGQQVSLVETEDVQAIPPRVEAIIGIIPEQKQNIVVLKTRKMHLRLLRENEKAYRDLSEEGHHKTLTARIN